MTTRVASLLAMLERGQDSALLRFSLGNELLAENNSRQAVTHLRKALQLDPEYSAAWKLLGKALTDNNEVAAAIDCYQRGIATAEAKGDRQAVKEMQVFLRRLERKTAAGGG